MDQDARWNRLELARLWADLVGKVLSGIALVVAAWWTYMNFTVERTHDPTMEVNVSPSVHPLHGSDVLLNVDVFLRNIGKVAIKPKFPRKDNDQNLGLEISIVEIEPLGRGPVAASQPTADGRAFPFAREVSPHDHGVADRVVFCRRHLMKQQQ